VNGSVLATRDITVRYGGVHALTDVSIDVQAGEMVGLIGPNGAGKTTFIDAVTGFAKCRGHVELGGKNISNLKPHARACRGLARTWQTVELFDDLTVGENLAVAAGRPSIRRAVIEVFRNGDRTLPPVKEALTMLGIAEFADAMPGQLSEGQRKLVGVARAVAAAPTILCLDEPAAGLDTSESALLAARLRPLADRGIPMLLIDHDMGFVFSICDRIYVLEFGRIIACGTPQEVRRDQRVVKAYLGESGATIDLEPGR